jgi:hypothetical protein
VISESPDTIDTEYTSGTPDAFPEQAEPGLPLIDIDFTLGITASSLYAYDIEGNEHGYTDVKFSDYSGFLSAVDKNGETVLLTPDIKPVEYPDGDYDILETFIFNERVYFRVQARGTGWVEAPPRYEGAMQLGDYAIFLSDGEEITKTVDLGEYDYIDRHVDGKLRAYSVEDACYYIIDPDGKVLKEFPNSGKVAPYRLYPDGYYYTRSDVSGHSHAIVSWDGDEVIPYGTHRDDIRAVYAGDGVFISLVSSVSGGVYTAALRDADIAYRVEFTFGQKPVLLPPDDAYSPTPSGEDLPSIKLPDGATLLSASEGKVVTYTVVNGLVGPLAKREYTVTDYGGVVLVEPGQYVFASGWVEGFCLARSDSGYVILDADCAEVPIPDGIMLVGQYAEDAALYVAEVTVDFKLWRYADVPARYEHPLGILDGNFHWVVPPGEIAAVDGIPLKSVTLFGDCATDETRDGRKLLRIVPA